MPVWDRVNGAELNQGDLLPKILIPIIPDTFPTVDATGNIQLGAEEATVVVLSQSCDLELAKIDDVIVAQTFTLDAFEEINADYKKKGKWKEVARGRVAALHLLRSPEKPTDPRACLVVDFRRVAILPLGYVTVFAGACGDRWRLQSPYIECLAQAFGVFFMRVALPEEIPDF